MVIKYLIIRLLRGVPRLPYFRLLEIQKSRLGQELWKQQNPGIFLWDGGDVDRLLGVLDAHGVLVMKMLVI